MSLARLVTDWAFLADSEGRRLFAPYWIGFRPYVIPDETTACGLARRLAAAQVQVIGLWGAALFAILFWAVSIGGDLLAFFDPAPFFGLLAGGVVVGYAAMWAALRRVVRGLARDARRLSLRTVAADMAARQSGVELAIRVTFAGGLIAFGFQVAVARSLVVGMTIGGVSLILTAQAGYAFWLRRRAGSAPKLTTCAQLKSRGRRKRKGDAALFS
jgi:hypothetical protein